jgi:carbonic anhydrase
MPTRNLDAIVKRISPALETIKSRAAGDDLVQLGIEANIRQSARDILEESPIVRQELASGRLMMVNALYRLKTGEVARL